jgi:hypothetical protein
MGLFFILDQSYNYMYWTNIDIESLFSNPFLFYNPLNKINFSNKLGMIHELI